MSEVKEAGKLESETSLKEYSLGNRMKSYEPTENVPPYLPFIVRADGKSFSKYTRGLERPFDDRFQRAIVRTGNGLLEFFNARTVFACSDEITLIFDRVITREELEKIPEGDQKPTHPFNGRRFKIETLVASKASVLFNRFMIEELGKTAYTYSHSVIERVQRADAIFDARLIVFGEGFDHEIVNNIIWRSCYECYRNSVSTYARYHLGPSAIFKKRSSEMIEMMKENGVKWEEIPPHYLYGVLCKKRLVTLTNEKGEEFVRGKVVNFSLPINSVSMTAALDMLLSKYRD